MHKKSIKRSIKNKKKGSIKKFNKTKNKKTINKNIDKYIGKAVYLKLPNNSQKRWYWIVRKKKNNRYIIRSPKIGVLIKDLNKLNNSDYDSEKIMPVGTKLF
tara:strand:+ start:1693 stop:1998 length:306 start_codon:yes stop_codon:yes gene_type:complete